MKRVIINKRTAKIFWRNIQKKKYMVCWMPYVFKIGDKEYQLLDIAQTRYHDFGGVFSISCRGTGYMDSFLIEGHDPVAVIEKYVHSFIVCKNMEGRS